MKQKKYDPKEPMALAMERLEPFFSSDEDRRKAQSNPFMMEQAKRDAYGIYRNGGAKNQAEIDAIKKAKKAKKGGA